MSRVAEMAPSSEERRTAGKGARSARQPRAASAAAALALAMASAACGGSGAPSSTPPALPPARPATLSASLSVDAAVGVGRTFTVRMTVSNAGGAAALGVRPTPLALGPGSVPATLVTGPDPAAADVPGATGAAPGTATFAWTWAAGDSEGTLQLTGGASGTDANGGSPVAAPSVSSNASRVGRGTLIASAAAAPATVSVGQTFTLELTVANTGTAPVTGLAPSAPAATGTGAVALATGPMPPSVAALEPGQSATFGWTLQATGAGPVDLGVAVAGTDAFSGAPVGASGTAAVAVRPSAALEVAELTASRTRAYVNQPVAVAMTLRNLGAATASVTSVMPAVAPPGGAGCTAPAPPATPEAPVLIEAGAARTFAWSCAPTAAGTWTLGAAVAATDAASGLSVAPAVAGIPVTIEVAATLEAQLEVISGRAIFFDHASVGENVMRGVRALLAANAGPEPVVVTQNTALDPSAMGPGVWAETNHLYHQNGRPADKFAQFRADLEAGAGARVDLAMMKLCFADFPTGTPAAATFAAYQATLDTLRAEFPGIRFVHVTVPLETVSSGGYANPDREAVSALIRAAYGPSGLVFDLALVESTRPDGTRELDGHGVPALVPGYSDDGGHLGAVGRDRAARALVQFLAGVP